jgi:hypothetical protein
MTAPPEYPATIAEALAKLHTQLPHIGKTAEAQYGKYADLADVNHAVLPLMGHLGLSFSAKLTTRKGQFGLRYKFRLAGSSETDKGFIPLTGTTPQQVGSATTYFRRYVLNAWTGAAPDDEDDDGQAAEQAPRQESSSGGRWMNRRPDLPPPHLRDKIVPGDRPGPELEQLRAGTVEAAPEDRPGQRVRAGHNGGDPWTDQPAGQFDETPPEERTGSIDGRQRSQIFKRFADLGISTPTAQRAILGDILHREVSSRAGLSWVDAETVLKDLQARVEAKEAAVEAAAQDAAAEATP